MLHRREQVIEAGLMALAVGFLVVGYAWLEPAAKAYEPGQRKSDDLRVVTWNVGGKGGETGQPLSDDWIAAIGQTLGRLDADLVFLQEVRDEHQLDRLVKEVGLAYRGELTGRGDRRSAMLYQRGSLPYGVVKSRAKHAVYGTMYRRSHGMTLGVVAVHAEPYSAKKRNDQIGKAIDSLANLPRSDAKILVGDFNIDLDLDKRRDLFSNNAHLDVETYNYITTRFRDVGVGRGATADPDRRLDYIFIDERLTVINAGPWKNKRVGLMDHDPFVADLRWVTR